MTKFVEGATAALSDPEALKAHSHRPIWLKTFTLVERRPMWDSINGKGLGWLVRNEDGDEGIVLEGEMSLVEHYEEEDGPEVTAADVNRASASAAFERWGGKTDPEPAPLDPGAVKPGDTVTLSRGNSTARGAVTHVEDFLHLEELGRYRVKGLGDGTRTGGYTEWTLTAHTPAPEPEWKPGTVAALTVWAEDDSIFGQEDPSVPVAVRGVWDGEEWQTLPDEHHKGQVDVLVTDVRPLVAVDPADLADLVAVVREVAALHQSRPNSTSALYPKPLCTCGVVWENCPTATATARAEAILERLAR